jgi:signal transduction histidine kinase
VIAAGSAPAGQVAILHDSVDRGEALARMLRPSGHQVTVVRPGPGALATLLAASPDLVVGTLYFGDQPLRETMAVARGALGPDVPLVIVLGREDADAVVKADEVIREPVDAGELSLRVGSLIARQVERRTLQKRIDRLSGLNRTSWVFSIAGGAEALFGQIARYSAEALRAEKGLVLLYDAERREIEGQVPGFGVTREEAGRVHYPVDGEPRDRWNFRMNGPLVSNQAASDPHLLPEMVSALGLRSVMIVPLALGPQITGLLLVGDRPASQPFRDDDLGVLQGVAGQAAVAIENHRLHEQIKEANARLQEYDRMKSEFVAIIAHDFRSPLMAIRGFAELVLEDADLPLDSRQEFMQTIMDQTDDLARLANDTLLISRLETGQLEYNWLDVELAPLILEAVPLGLARHSVVTDVPAASPAIVADADRLKQVVTNLLNNAVKYSPEGGAITVRVRVRDPQHVVIEVADQGLGIPADQVGRLFQKFERVRTDEHMRVSGTGLGLYICRRIVEGHGGRIWVESEPGRGSTFSILLPVDARAETTPAGGGKTSARSAPPSATAPSAPARPH